MAVQYDQDHERNHTMTRFLLLLSVGLLLALPAMPQEDTGEPAADETAEASDATDVADEDAELDDELPEDADLDEQTYEENEDVFVPTQEIPADEPIPFPTNI